MSGFKPFKFIKDYSKQHPLRFYSIICVVSATAYGELKFRSMRRKELLIENKNESEPKNEYEQYLISQKKLKENKISLDEERNKLKNIINNSSKDGDSEKREKLLNNTKDKLNQLKNSVIAKKESFENDEKIKNTKKNISESFQKIKNNTKNLSSKISKENISSKVNIRKSFSKKSSKKESPSSNSNINDADIEVETTNKELENNNNLSIFHKGNEKFKDYFQRITKKETSPSLSSFNNYGITSNNRKDDDDEIYSEELSYDSNPPERAIFLYDINSSELNKN
jgi:hypothetical protein